MSPFYDNYDNEDYNNESESPSDIFLRLLESQLAIIIQSTNVTHAAVYISSDNDERDRGGTRENEEEGKEDMEEREEEREGPVMQLVCSYPPSSRSYSNSNIEDYDDHNDSYESDMNADNGAGDRLDRNGGSSSSKYGGQSGGRTASIGMDNSKKIDKDRTDSMNTVTDSTYGDDIVKPSEWTGGVTIYPIQYRGIKLGILHTLVSEDLNEEGMGDAEQVLT